MYYESSVFSTEVPCFPQSQGQSVRSSWQQSLSATPRRCQSCLQSPWTRSRFIPLQNRPNSYALCRSSRKWHDPAATQGALQVVCPVLHHSCAGLQVEGVVVGSAYGVAWRVGKL